MERLKIPKKLPVSLARFKKYVYNITNFLPEVMMMRNRQIRPFLYILAASLCMMGGCASKDIPEVNIIQEDIPNKTEQTEEPETPEDNTPDYASLPAGTVIEEELQPEQIDMLFNAQEISEEVFERIHGISYVENENIALSDLRYVRVLHTGFDEKTHIGELIVNAAITDQVLTVFRTLYDSHYQIEKILLVDTYGGDDSASMKDNNTSAFNYRVVEGSTHLSQHAYGLAIDVNPLYNPYVTYENGQAHYAPEGSEAYGDRSLDLPHKISKDADLCWQLFHEQGFTWGGDWNSVKDYQHFQFPLP